MSERQEGIDYLKKRLVEGQSVYTVLRHVAPSGMTRYLDIYVVKDNQIERVTWSVAKACGYSYDRKRECLKVRGCGMDMGFAVVYDLMGVLGIKDLRHSWL